MERYDCLMEHFVIAHPSCFCQSLNFFLEKSRVETSKFKVVFSVSQEPFVVNGKNSLNLHVFFAVHRQFP